MKALEFSLRSTLQPLTDAWKRAPVAPRGATRLGISFRSLQAAAFGLEPRAALRDLLAYPFELIRLGAYWNRIEPEPGAFHPDELDEQIDAADAAGKQVIVCLGPLKTFGYPEFFVPGHHLPRPFAEGRLIQPSDYPALVEAANDYLTRLVERYRQRTCIAAWQLEHEAVDPLGVEHSWRLAAGFVAQEAAALRKADPTRPVMMNGYLPTSALVRLSQGWSTRDQGDSLALAQRMADWVGIDYYPRNALVSVGNRTLYLDGSQNAWQQRRRRQLQAWAGAHGKKLLIAEGQAEPWETVTTPPNPHQHAMCSCLPEQVIGNYNACLEVNRSNAALEAYLFWGAEYWMLRKQGGDMSYLRAFERILKESG